MKGEALLKQILNGGAKVVDGKALVGAFEHAGATRLESKHSGTFILQLPDRKLQIMLRGKTVNVDEDITSAARAVLALMAARASAAQKNDGQHPSL